SNSSSTALNDSGVGSSLDISLSLALDLVLLDLLVEVSARRVDRLRGLGHVPAFLLEFLQDEELLRERLEVAQRLHREQRLGKSWLRAAADRHQVLARHRVAGREDQESLDEVLELAHVALPRQALEEGERLGSERLESVVVRLGVAAQKVVDQRRNVLE